MESAKIFNRIINFRNIAEIEDKLVFTHNKFDGHTCLDKTESLIVKFPIKFMRSDYFYDEVFYFNGFHYTNTEKIDECKAEFKRFLECFDRYCMGNVFDCSKQV